MSSANHLSNKLDHDLQLFAQLCLLDVLLDSEMNKGLFQSRFLNIGCLIQSVSNDLDG